MKAIISERIARNREFYRQALNSAQHLDPVAQAELTAELAAREQFEQQRLTENLQVFEGKRPLVKGWWLAFGVLALACAIYWQTGRWDVASVGREQHLSFQQQQAEMDSEARNERYILNLQQRLRDNPNDGELWYELGQAYALNNDFEAAMICYHNAQSVLGEKPAVLGAMATADYYQNKQRLSEQAQAWIAQALAKDPKDSASLLLLASDSFLQNDFAQALHYWRLVLDSDNEAINRRAIIQSMTMAEQRLRAEMQK